MDMSQSPKFWEENSNIQHVKYESVNLSDEHPRLKDERGLYSCCDGNLNFATATCSEDDSEYSNGLYKKGKVSRQDPMSHRIIEKRRRDRMNNCLADLSRLIPAEYLKKGRGRIEKTEIIEMAIKHMKYLQHLHTNPSEHYRLGYQECMSEVMRFLVEVEGHFPREAICVRLLNHLQKHCEALSRVPHPVRERPLQDSYHDEVQNASANHPSPALAEKTQQIDAIEHPLPKCDIENNDTYPISKLELLQQTNSSESEQYDKQSDSNGSVMYKYKTNIKLRFNQDLTSAAKRQRLENGRRPSLTSLENHSSSHGSPPSSELCNSENQTSPTQGSVNRTLYFKSESGNTTNGHDYEYSHIPNGEHHVRNNTKGAHSKGNFNVPIFVLHAKGSFYVPLTIDYYTLSPFLQNYNLLEEFPNTHSIVLHPVTINVNFQPAGSAVKFKSDCMNSWH